MVTDYRIADLWVNSTEAPDSATTRAAGLPIMRTLINVMSTHQTSTTGCYFATPIRDAA